MHEEKKHVTLVSTCKALRDDGLFAGSRSSLGKLLGKMGFWYKKSITKGKYINILSLNNLVNKLVSLCVSRHYFEQPCIMEKDVIILRAL